MGRAQREGRARAERAGTGEADGRGRYSEAIGMRLGRSAMYRIRIILLKPVLRCALVISRALGLRYHRRAEKRITCWQSRLDR